MKFIVYSQDEFTLTYLVEMIHQSDDRTEAHYSQIIEFALQELVHQSMRSLAVNPDYRSDKPILELAIKQVQQQLQERLGNQKFSLSAYIEDLRRSLKPSAKEIDELAKKRRQLRQENPEKPQIIRTAAGIVVKIIRVGRPEAIEALIAIPETEELEIQINQFSELYEVEGDWFPLQVTVKELPFVIDDDGRIYICTDNFPATLLDQAQQAIVMLAEQIYRQIEQT